MKALITRSEPGASRMAQGLAARGIEPVVCPLLRVEPTLIALPDDCFDHVIFVSEHAVSHGAAVVRALAGKPQWYAIGPATASALTKLVVAEVGSVQGGVRVPALSRSEGLLEEPELQAEALGSGANKILLVAGENGRELIADTLIKRGADVTLWLVYRRVEVPTKTQLSVDVDIDIDKDIDVCVASSGSGLELLTRVWRETGGGYEVPVCVPSPRVAQMATALGWSRPVVCEGASAEATLGGLVEAGLLEAHSSGTTGWSGDSGPNHT